MGGFGIDRYISVPYAVIGGYRVVITRKEHEAKFHYDIYSYESHSCHLWSQQEVGKVTILRSLL